MKNQDKTLVWDYILDYIRTKIVVDNPAEIPAWVEKLQDLDYDT